MRFPPIATALLLLCASIITPSSYAADPTANAGCGVSSLVERVLAAYGGRDTIEKMESLGFLASATISSGPTRSGSGGSYPCTILSLGERFSIESRQLGQESVLAFDGKSGWTKSGNWVAGCSASTSRRMRADSRCHVRALLSCDQAYTTIAAKQGELIGGVLCPGIEIAYTDGPPITLYIHPATHLIVRAEYQGDTPAAAREKQTLDFQDYKAVDGYPVPFTQICALTDGTIVETRLSSIEPDQEITGADFAMPAESAISFFERGPVHVPIELARSLILVRAQLDHLPPAWFILDTGAGRTLLDRRFANSIGPYTVEKTTESESENDLSRAYIRVTRLRIGDLDLRDLSLGITDLSVLSDALATPVAGLLGTDLLSRFQVSIDFNARKLSLAAPRSEPVARGAVAVPVRAGFRDSALIAFGRIDNESSELPFLVDTGANFNSLPQRTLDALKPAPALTLGRAALVGGNSKEFGSIKLQSLTLASITIPQPAFGVPEGSADPTSSGAGRLGVLGCPALSSFTATLDIRNESLYLEAPPGWAQAARVRTELEAVHRIYLKTGDLTRAENAYRKLSAECRSSGLLAGEALSGSAVADCLVERYLAARDTQWLQKAQVEYARAAAVAERSRNRSAEGTVLSSWAVCCLEHPLSNRDLQAGKSLVEKALKRCPPQPLLYAELASSMLRRGQRQQAREFTNQALLLDPANWTALWTRYRMAEQDKDKRELQRVLAQLTFYYPDFPQVRAARARTPNSRLNGEGFAKPPRKRP